MTTAMDNSQNGANDVTSDKDNSQTPDQSVVERYKQQIEWSKQEALKQKQDAEKARVLARETAIMAAKLDGNSLLELYSKDPDFAEEVAKDGFWLSIDEVRTQMNGGETIEEKPAPNLTTEDLEKWYQDRLAKDTHTQSLQLADKQFENLPEELREEAKQEFNMLAEWRTLTPEQATKFADMVTLSVSRWRVKDQKYQELVTWMASTSTKSAQASTSPDDQMVVIWWKLVPLSSVNQ